MGAAEGNTIGSLVGAGVGASGALPEDKAAQLRLRLDHVLQAHSLVAELARDVTDRAQTYWILSPTQPTTQLTVELQGLQLTTTRDERVRCEVRVLVYVAPSAGKPAAARPRPKSYEYVGPFSSLELWLGGDSDFIDVDLSNASRKIAAEIISDLAPR